jgi:hypothetical protein
MCKYIESERLPYYISESADQILRLKVRVLDFEFIDSRLAVEKVKNQISPKAGWRITFRTL